MTDKPKVNTDCVDRERGGRDAGREGEGGKLYYSSDSQIPVNPSLKFTDFRSESKKFKTNANCLKKLSLNSSNNDRPRRVGTLNGIVMELNKISYSYFDNKHFS